MSNIAACFSDVSVSDLAVSEGSHCDIEPSRWPAQFDTGYLQAADATFLNDRKDQRSPQADTGFQATSVTFIYERKEWLIEAYKKLFRLASLEDDWDSYGAEAPSQDSIDLAQRVLRVMDILDFEPSSIDASAEGGVCLSFQHGDRYGDVECFNSGEVLAVTSADGAETKVWEITDTDQNLRYRLSKIRTFVAL